MNELLKVFEGSLPVLAWLISYWIQQEHWPPAMNTAVAGGSIALVAIITVFLQGRLTHDIIGDLVLTVGVATALQGEAMAPLNQWLRANFPSKSSHS